jgi:S1-C subfamily serine protease
VAAGCGRLGAGSPSDRLAAAFAQPFVRVSVAWPPGQLALPRVATAVGSGWFAASGLVVTAAHVVAAAMLPLSGLPAWVLGQGRHAPGARVSGARVLGRQVGVLLPDGRRLPATVAAYGQSSGPGVSPLDVAVLAVRGVTGPTLRLGPAFHNGEAVWVLGAEAEGQPPALRPGLVRAAGPGVAILSADLAPGVSGGAVVGRDGRVQGILAAISRGVPGLAWAVPSATVRAFLARVEGPAVPARGGR